MTILSSDSTLAGVGTATLPRVNLLPPEIAEARAFRRVQAMLGVAVLAAVGVCGVLYVSAAHGVSSAQSELDSANAQKVSLQRDIARYGGVQATYAQAAAAKVQLAMAMGDEVRYSQLLNDLALAVPGNVWLSSVSLEKAAPVKQATPATATRPGTVTPTTVTGPTPLAQLTFSGVAFGHDDVATWLEALTRIKGLQDAYFDKSAEELIGPRTVVNFQSNVLVTSDMLSQRYTKAG